MAESHLVTLPAALVRQYDVRSQDGTRIRAWTNDGTGPDVLITNGLGTNPHAWPTLLQPDSGFRVHGNYHRGIGGSARPDNGRIGVDAHVEDAIAVMDAAGMESAVLVGWSIGVNVAFELAHRHPDRVRGILSICGVPGDTFATMLQPLHLPGPLAKALVTAATYSTIFTGRASGPVLKRWPWNRFTVDLIRTAHVISPAAETVALQALVQEFFQTHPSWYAQLGMAAARHGRVSLSGIDVPTSFVAGSWDVLAGPDSMRTAAERMPHSRFREIARATHFVPIEHPGIVMGELRDLESRCH